MVAGYIKPLVLSPEMVRKASCPQCGGEVRAKSANVCVVEPYCASVFWECSSCREQLTEQTTLARFNEMQAAERAAQLAKPPHQRPRYLRGWRSEVVDPPKCIRRGCARCGGDLVAGDARIEADGRRFYNYKCRGCGVSYRRREGEEPWQRRRKSRSNG